MFKRKLLPKNFGYNTAESVRYCHLKKEMLCQRGGPGTPVAIKSSSGEFCLENSKHCPLKG